MVTEVDSDVGGRGGGGGAGGGGSGGGGVVERLYNKCCVFICVTHPSVWDSLTLHIRNATTIDTFKTTLKTNLFNLEESD